MRGKAARAQGGDRARLGTRATHSPPAAAPVAAGRCKAGSQTTRPLSRRRRRRHRRPRAPAGSPPCVQRSIQRRGVSGLRSGESPPPGSAGSAGRRRAASARRKGRGRARTPATRCARRGPRLPLGRSRVTSAAPPPGRRAAAPPRPRPPGRSCRTRLRKEK